jgi:diaminopimelate epimerase
MIGIPVVKAHAFGNDFLLVDGRDLVEIPDRPALARAMCARHRGIGADGLIVFSVESDRQAVGGERSATDDDRPAAARMHLFNADGSYSEVSGNGVRCLAAWLVACGEAARTVDIETDAGVKRLELLDHREGRHVFRAAMGPPEQVARVTLEVGGRPVDAITLRVGNPQCVVLGEVTEERLHTIAAALAVHPHFPEGTNVELAAVERPDLVNILIWERGVGPTEASGTGACAAAVAAMTAGGAARDVQVVSPGGAQRVEWTAEGLFLTGWAEVVAEATWLR